MKRRADEAAHAGQTAWRRQAKKRILSNNLAAKEVHEDLSKAQSAGARGCEDFLATKGGKNAQRDLLNKMLRENEWPGLYWADIPVADLKTGKVKTQAVPFLLPHEWLPMYTRWPEAFDDLRPGEEVLQRRQHTLARQLKADPAKLVMLGMHGDGMPIGGTLNPDSLDVFNLNMPTSTKHGRMRIPFVCMQLKHLAPGTFAAIVKVLCWSLRCLATGKRATCRRDGSPFESKEDKKRRPNPEQGTDLGVQAVLAEIRGDWKWLQKLFHFPAWNKGTGFCWLCKCVLKDMRLLDTAAAPWRFERMTGEEFLQLCRLQGIPVCEMFSLPGVSPDIVFPDWMHSADMGVTQDVLAHVFHEVPPHMEGNSLETRTEALFGCILKYYERFQVENRLHTLQAKNFTTAGATKANKMKCKASIARDLVPFLPTLCRRFLNSGSEHDRAVQVLVQSLADCYKLMETPGPDLRKASQRFANAYAALEHEVLQRNPNDPHWRIKPKLHLFLQLCEFGQRVARLFWCYMDETFGNVIAHLAQRRGGVDNPGKKR